MAGQLRFEYPGAVHQIMARGDGGKCILPGKEDHLSFLHRARSAHCVHEPWTSGKRPKVMTV